MNSTLPAFKTREGPDFIFAYPEELMAGFHSLFAHALWGLDSSAYLHLIYTAHTDLPCINYERESIQLLHEFNDEMQMS